MTKMGICYHPHCGLRNRKKVERCKMFYCTRCGDINYCSIECQKADWGGHKEFCDDVLEMKTAFDSRLILNILHNAAVKDARASV